MTQSIITAGDASAGTTVSSGNDGTLVVLTGAAGSKVNALNFAADGTPTFLKPLQGNSLTLGTAQNTTSGTAIDFLSIPSWVKRITMMFNSVSLSGAALPIVQLGSGSPQTTGYIGNVATVNNAGGAGGISFTSGFALQHSAGAAISYYGQIILTHMGSNIWTVSGNLSNGATATNAYMLGGLVSLSGVLDRVRLTSSNGTDTFDLGSVNILYEG